MKFVIREKNTNSYFIQHSTWFNVDLQKAILFETEFDAQCCIKYIISMLYIAPTWFVLTNGKVTNYLSETKPGYGTQSSIITVPEFETVPVEQKIIIADTIA